MREEDGERSGGSGIRLTFTRIKPRNLVYARICLQERENNRSSQLVLLRLEYKLCSRLLLGCKEGEELVATLLPLPLPLR